MKGYKGSRTWFSFYEHYVYNAPKQILKQSNFVSSYSTKALFEVLKGFADIYCSNQLQVRNFVTKQIDLSLYRRTMQTGKKYPHVLILVSINKQSNS